MMEENLVNKLTTKLERSNNLRLRVIMDYYRGNRNSRNEHGGVESSSELFERVATCNINADIQIGFLECSLKPRLSRNPLMSLLATAAPQVQEILGVHHTKFAVFDNSVILTGANFEEQYFLNRRDRYWIINECEELADYLEDYSLNLLSASEMIDWSGERCGVSASAKSGSRVTDSISKLVGIGKSGGYSSLASGHGSQTHGLSPLEFKKKMKNMMGVFTYLGYKDALEMRDEVEAKMLGEAQEEEGKVQIEEESTPSEIMIKGGESKDEVLQKYLNF